MQGPDCELSHHKRLHKTQTTGTAHHHQSNPDKSTSPIGKSSCLLQLMRIKANEDDNVNVLWDGGATISLITFKKAAELGLHGEEVKLDVIKVGGVTEEINSNQYELTLIDCKGIECDIIVYGIDKISTELNDINITEISKLFQTDL